MKYTHSLLISLTLVTLAPPALAQEADNQVVTNAVSNLCLGVRGVDDHKAGAEVEVYWCNPGGGDRGRDNQWTFEPADEGFVFIKNRVSGLCLGVRGVDDHKPGTGAEVYPCKPGGADKGHDGQWRLVPDKDGFRRIENRVSGLCLGVRGVDDHKPAAGVEVYTCDPGRGDAARDGRWRFQGL